ncbi:hypothetical protein ACFL05_00225 [Patescibacteria group bacterium]
MRDDLFLKISQMDASKIRFVIFHNIGEVPLGVEINEAEGFLNAFKTFGGIGRIVDTSETDGTLNVYLEGNC